MDADAVPNPEVLFRPVKRRKFLRRRPEDTDTQQETQPSNAVASTPQSPQDDTETVPAADALRLRRLHRSRKGGIEFSATSRPTADHETQASLSAIGTAEDVDTERLKAVSDRFTLETGQAVNVDKHMMDYIESEMAKRYRRGMPGEAPGPDTASPNEVYSAISTSDLPEREPASLGKLHEIDLGQETKLQNIARTEAATRRLKGEDDGFSTERSTPNAPSRNWKRRTSEDIERDRLVEEVLRESKLDVYDEPEEEEAAADNQAADDRVAEQFRRDFLDALQSRRRVARTKTTKPGKTDAPKGPKLGGSRSARAAMREMQEKAGRK